MQPDSVRLPDYQAVSGPDTAATPHLLTKIDDPSQLSFAFAVLMTPGTSGSDSSNVVVTVP